MAGFWMFLAHLGLCFRAFVFRRSSKKDLSRLSLECLGFGFDHFQRCGDDQFFDAYEAVFGFVFLFFNSTETMDAT